MLICENENLHVWWKSPPGVIALFFLFSSIYVLVVEYSAHIVPYLPWFILLLCPPVHIVHYSGNGHDNHDINDILNDEKIDS